MPATPHNTFKPGWAACWLTCLCPLGAIIHLLFFNSAAETAETYLSGRTNY